MDARTTPAVPVAILLTAAVVVAGYRQFDGAPSQGAVMLILRGVASAEKPRGQLDDRSALEYASRLGYRGEVLDVAGNTSAQASMALDRIRRDEKVTAIYGFSGGGYNTRRIWSELKADERRRIDKIVVVGSPGVDKGDFAGSADVVIKEDPPAGHMAGPKALLELLNPS